MIRRSPEIGDSTRLEEPMSLEQVDRPVGEPAETGLDARVVEEQPKVDDQARPDPLKLFHAQWERYKPAYEFLAGS